MIMLEITDVKSLMKKLLYEEAFDSFLLGEATVKMGSTFIFDGHINKGFYSDEEIDILKEESVNNQEIFDSQLIRWRSVKSHVLSIIKGKKTPLYFSIVFYLPPEKIISFFEDANLTETPDLSRLMLQLKFDSSSLKITTGTVYNTFSLDNTPDKKWDEAVTKLLSNLSVSFEML